MKVTAMCLLSALCVQADQDAIFFNSDVAVSGDLTKDAVTDVDTCWATGSDPQAFTSQAPQFCLTVSGTGKDRCCTPTHDVYIKDHV